jgi:hypothetical protein
MSNYPDNFNAARADRYNGDDTMTENEKFIENMKDWVNASMMHAELVMGISGEELDNFYNDLILTITESSLEKRYVDAVNELGTDDFFNCRMVRMKGVG